MLAHFIMQNKNLNLDRDPKTTPFQFMNTKFRLICDGIETPLEFK